MSTTSHTMASVDDDLAWTTSQRLSLGSSIVSDLDLTPCVLPRKLHPGLYNNSMNDVSMRQQRDSSPNENDVRIETITNGEGVPGFPDFPDCWQGETSSERIKNIGINRGRKWKTPTDSQRHQRRLFRRAVNTVGIAKPAAVCKAKEIKKRLREKRRTRRMEKVEKLRERRRRKSDMGAICRGVESIICK